MPKPERTINPTRSKRFVGKFPGTYCVSQKAHRCAHSCCCAQAKGGLESARQKWFVAGAPYFPTRGRAARQEGNGNTSQEEQPRKTIAHRDEEDGKQVRIKKKEKKRGKCTRKSKNGKCTGIWHLWKSDFR